MGRVNLYYFVVFLTFVYVVIRNRSSLLKILIILCFYSGLAAFPGKSIENPYKILLVLFSLYLLFDKKSLSSINSKQRLLLVIFILFSASFFFSALINGDYFTLIFSQYGKYVTPICLLYVFYKIKIKDPYTIIKLKSLFLTLLTIQIVLSFVKIMTVGLIESVVGSIAYIGGGPATMVPVLGFILVWLDKQGSLKRRDWIYIGLLLFTAFASLKRAVWFIMPVVIVLFLFYIPRKLRIRNILYALPLIPLIIYLGARLNPTLNREGKFGGSFDINYVLDYTQMYSFGITQRSSEVQPGIGRGGATKLLFLRLFSDRKFTSQDYWGSGLKEIYTTDYNTFNQEKYGVNSLGSVTGIFQSYISAGYVGVVLTVFFIIAVCNLILEPRIRITMMFILFSDYLFYSGLILRTQALFVLFFYLIIYSNILSDPKINNSFNRNVTKRSKLPIS